MFIIFTVKCNMDELSPRFWMPKTLDKKKECVINSVSKSTGVTRTNGHYRFFDNGKTKEDLRFAPSHKVDC